HQVYCQLSLQWALARLSIQESPSFVLRLDHHPPTQALNPMGSMLKKQALLTRYGLLLAQYKVYRSMPIQCDWLKGRRPVRNTISSSDPSLKIMPVVLSVAEEMLPFFHKTRTCFHHCESRGLRYL